MDVIITAIAEFIWTVSCGVVNFCVSSGFSVLAVFVSFLCAILASAFYKYNISREQMSLDGTTTTYTSVDEVNNDLDKPDTIESTIESSITSLLPIPTVDVADDTTKIQSLNEIEISVNENGGGEDQEQITDDMLIDTIEGSEEEIQKQQIANIYRLLNDQHLINNWSTTDFLDQLKMYGLHAYDDDNEDELEPESEPEAS